MMLPTNKLSPMETRVARLLAVGRTNREIAQILGAENARPLSVKTIDTHRGHVLGKLGLRNNVDLAREALRRGWATLDRAPDEPTPPAPSSTVVDLAPGQEAPQ